MKEKTFILCVCLLGIVGVCYGLSKKDHVVFFGGLAFLIAGYLMFRKKLKRYLREKYLSKNDPEP